MSASNEGEEDQVKPFHVVLVGGGHAHIHSLKYFGTMKDRPKGVRFILISDSPTTYYSGAIPASIARIYEPRQSLIKLRGLASWGGWDFVRGKVTSIDPQNRHVFIEGEEHPLHYDILGIDVGSVANLPHHDPIMKECAVPTRPASKMEKMIYDFEQNWPENEKNPKIIVVGGGPAGVELAMAVSARFRPKLPDIQVMLIDRNKTLLKEHGYFVSRTTMHALHKRNIEVLLNTSASHATEEESDGKKIKTLHLSNGQSLEFNMLIWAAGPAPNPLLKKTNLPLSDVGSIKVHPTLEVLSHPDIFATGDCATIQGFEWVPKAGVIAVSEGPVLSQNIEKLIFHHLKKNQSNETDYHANCNQKRPKLHEYQPKKSRLQLLMTGDGEAIMSWWGIGTHGKWVWEWKNKLDRNWMDLYDVDLLPTSESLEFKGGDDCSVDARKAFFSFGKSNHGSPQTSDIISPDSRMSPEEYKKEYLPEPQKEIQRTHVLIDVRPEKEFQEGALPNAINIPFTDDLYLEEIQKKLEGITFNEEGKPSDVVVVCRRGNDSQIVVRELQQMFEKESSPFIFKDMKGGLTAWQRLVDNDFPL